ncbi:MAG: TRAP transporter small permease [Desulfobacteraceae bacterium]|nr:MAG: TRAP transporter small permease [Desulfobacteraceae bacterium]
MKKTIDAFNGFLLAVMFLITFYQIIARYLPGDSTVWSEEVARFLFVWIVFLGAATLVLDEAHIRISVITDRLSPAAQRFVRVFSALLIIPFVFIMGWGGYTSMIRQWGTFAPTAGWMRLGYVYLALFFSGAVMLLYYVRRLYRDLFPHSPVRTSSVRPESADSGARP